MRISTRHLATPPCCRHFGSSTRCLFSAAAPLARERSGIGVAQLTRAAWPREAEADRRSLPRRQRGPPRPNDPPAHC
eukprot:7179280-Pyramimonas_sp.AAC.1